MAAETLWRRARRHGVRLDHRRRGSPRGHTLCGRDRWPWHTGVGNRTKALVRVCGRRGSLSGDCYPLGDLQQISWGWPSPGHDDDGRAAYEPQPDASWNLDQIPFSVRNGVRYGHTWTKWHEPYTALRPPNQRIHVFKEVLRMVRQAVVHHCALWQSTRECGGPSQPLGSAPLPLWAFPGNPASLGLPGFRPHPAMSESRAACSPGPCRLRRPRGQSGSGYIYVRSRTCFWRTVTEYYLHDMRVTAPAPPQRRRRTLWPPC